jgi:ubiquinone/menaquinone biosynthesis C-methylase UbiE
MSSPVPPAAPDATAVKARQQKTWASGDFAVIASHIHSAAEHLAQAADLRAGWRVLDVATGSGNAALAAARCGCDVVGVDYVPALLERGRARAAAEGLSVDFREGDAEALPFRDGEFDAVLSIYGAMFAPRPERAAAEILRVVRPGGTIALASWTPTGFVGELLRTVGKHVPPSAGIPPPTQWGAEARLRELFGAGTSSIRSAARDFTFRYRSADEFVDVFRRFYGPTHKAFEALGDAKAPALRADFLALVKRHDRLHAGDGGPVAVPAEYLETVAVRA